MSDPQFLIYGLIDPRTLLVRYVGQSTRGTKRARSHRSESKLRLEEHTHKTRWIRGLHAAGFDYEIAILQHSTRMSIDADERWWIAFGRACGWPLTNLTDGGSAGFVFSEDALQKLRESRRKQKRPPHSQQAKDRIGAANRGKVRDPEVVALVAAKIRGTKRGPEASARTAAMNRARVYTPEMLERMRNRVFSAKALENFARAGAARRGRKPSEETRARMSAAHLGQKRSEETRLRMREAWVRRKARIAEGVT